ncbi:hypothetical protein BC831DRAFT_415026 [Entophlyctis helioformis]|nr:hypothetical protein BC831DRAFT_415026 [Entophlyctis helioformis]
MARPTKKARHAASAGAQATATATATASTAATTTATKAHSKTPAQLAHELLEWGRAHGARVSLLDIAENTSTTTTTTTNDNNDNDADSRSLHRGVLAASAISAGTEICFIPERLLLSETVVRASAIGAAVLSYIAATPADNALVNDSARHPHAGTLLAMAAFMVHESAHEGSHWQPYLASLPAGYALPIAWPAGRVANLLGGTPLEHLVRERWVWVDHGVGVVQRACGESFPPGLLTRERLLWAASAVWSRAFPKARPDKSQAGQDWTSLYEICMYPILDMLNHKRGHRIEWKMSDEGVSFVAVDGTAKGAELFNNYGPKGNENLFSNYGFVLEDNPEDYFKVFLNIRESDALRDDKMLYLQRVGACNGLVHLVFRDEGLPADLVSVTRVLVASRGDLAALNSRLPGADDKNDGHGDAVPHSKPVSLRNEMTAMSTLNGLFRAKLGALVGQTPDYAADEASYPDDAVPRDLARIYRDGQQRILESAIQATRQVGGTSVTTGWLDDVTIHTSNARLHTSSAELVDVAASAEEMDPEPLLALVVVNEAKLGAQSAWHEPLQTLWTTAQPADPSPEMMEDLKELFDEVVQGFLDSVRDTDEAMAERLSDYDAFVRAMLLVETEAVDVPAGWVGAHDGGASDVSDESDPLVAFVVGAL